MSTPPPPLLPLTLLTLLLLLPHVTSVPTPEDGPDEEALPADLEPPASEAPESGAAGDSEVSVRLHQEAVLECAPPPGAAHWRHRGGGDGGWRSVGAGDGGHRYAALASGQLRISSVRLEDAGEWRCDRLEPRSRRPLPGRGVRHRLAVTEPPHAVFLEVDGRRLDPGNVFLPVLEGSPLSVGCVAEGGVPPPRLSWRLALSGAAAAGQPHQQPLPLLSTQPHAPPRAAGHAVRSEARLERLMRAHHNASVACVVQHPALPQQTAQQVSLLLDVQYTPSFAISRTPGFGFPLLEGMAVSLKCDVDSNPPSSPVWVKDDGVPPVPQSNDGFLNFSAIRREHMGWYKCTSREASSIGYYLNVIYDEDAGLEQEGVSIGVSAGEPLSDEGGGGAGGQQLEAALGSAVTLQCPGGACWRRYGEPVGAGPQLSLERVLYQEAGVYRCEPDRRAQALLDQRRARLQVSLNVTGAPTVHPANVSVAARSGQSVTLRFEFCANPAVERALWLVASASAVLLPGNATGRLVAHNLTESASPLCREAALTLLEASPADSGEYSLLVRSPRGLAEGSASLGVARASASGLAAAPRPRPRAAPLLAALLVASRRAA